MKLTLTRHCEENPEGSTKQSGRQHLDFGYPVASPLRGSQGRSI
jgi:hypothetical protein